MWLGGPLGRDIESMEQLSVGREVAKRETLLIVGHVRGEEVVRWVLEGISRYKRQPGCLDLKCERIDIDGHQVC